MAYQIGQVLFIIFDKKPQIYPTMIIKEFIERTIQGEEISYLVQGGSDKSTTFFLNQVKGEIFEDIAGAKYYLTTKATNQIEKLTSTAVLKAKEWYSSKTENLQNQMVSSLVLPQPRSLSISPTTMTMAPIVNDVIRVELPDGSFANLKSFE